MDFSGLPFFSPFFILIAYGTHKMTCNQDFKWLEIAQAIDNMNFIGYIFYQIAV